jgi:glucuronate isomerase
MCAVLLPNSLEARLFEEMLHIPLVDVHSHINPRAPAARSLDDLLGYHYYTELAHSTGMPRSVLAADYDPRERCRQLLKYALGFNNTVQFEWLAEIARNLLGFMGESLTPDDADKLWELADKRMAQADWEAQVLRQTRVDQIFLTNDFDDPLAGFDPARYVPCLRVDDLVFRLGEPAVRERLAAVSGVDAGSAPALRRALDALFERFLAQGAKACAVSLPPDFEPRPSAAAELDRALANAGAADADRARALGVFWTIAECCRDHGLPLDLMLGVNRNVYPAGVPQGRDLFDQRMSLRQYAELFNAFPGVTFCVSVLAHSLNQELASYSWLFPNVVASGHWWYAGAPAYIEADCAARLQAVPRAKLLGYYSDAYKLEFILPKFNMYRQVLARILARDFVQARGWTETQAIDLAHQLLRGNAQRIFRLG